MNPCTIVGNVGSTPEMRYTPNGKAVTNFSFAGHGGQDQAGKGITTWYRVTCWGDLAEGVNSKVSKGDHLQLGGYLLPPRPYLRRVKDTKEIIYDEEGNPELGAFLDFTAFSLIALEYTERDLFPKELEEPESVDIVDNYIKSESSKSPVKRK